MPPTNETAVFNLRNMPLELKRQFKRKCRINEVTMREKTIELIRLYTSGQIPEKEGKRQR